MKFTKERSRHQYYKELIQELSEMKDVRKKINMSISDIDEKEFSNHGSSRNILYFSNKKSNPSRHGA